MHASLLDTRTQERPLVSLCTEQHLKNMGTFLAAITHFEGMEREIVNQAIQTECKKRTDELVLSSYVLQLVYKTKDVTLLQGHSHYTYYLTDYSPLFEFTTLGYCIANSSYKWNLVLGNSQHYMQSILGIDHLAQALGTNTSPSFAIHSITCYHEETDIPHQLLAASSEHTLQCTDTLWLASKTPKPLPSSLPQYLHKMNTLRVLGLLGATPDTLATTLQVVCTDNLERLSLDGSQFTLAAMHAWCEVVLRQKNTIDEVNLDRCEIRDELACYT